MQASNNGTPPAALDPRQAEALLLAAFHGANGCVVRCTPRRITRMVAMDGDFAFAKLRSSRPADAIAEWRWLRELPALGLPTPMPLGFVRRGRHTGILTRAVHGRPLDAWIADAIAHGQSLSPLVAFAVRAVAPRIAALHRAGLVYRDLYWNHLVAESIDGGDVTFLDVERVFAPRWRFERWRIKDLAGLGSSFPGVMPLRIAVAFLRAYLAAQPGLTRSKSTLRELLGRAGQKARRIRAHAPKFG